MFQKLQPIVFVLTVSLLFGFATSAPAQDGFFRQHVAPILQRRCLSCHNEEARKVDFSLQTNTSALAEGYIEAGDSSASRFVEVLIPVDGQAEMPKDADPLSTTEIDAIKKWIDAGAEWPAEMSLTAPDVADLNWWSLQPLKKPTVPTLTTDQSRIRTPIDAFVVSHLKAKGLKPSCEADRVTLIRRLYFDLLGLPPRPEEVAAFVNDSDSNAYEHVVDRLLESQNYGERWARHWLDVVHYADTHGYDKDKLRPNAWPYRDYVIRSLNSDKPYSRFVMEQIAGDALWPNTHDGITATGFIAAGPWDFIGHAEVPETKIDGRIARHLDRDDMVASTMNTFCSTTVQCARCHNHKFDPVTQEHYYSLQTVFAALDRADRPYDKDRETALRRAELQKQQRQLSDEKQALNQTIEQAAGEKLAEIDTRLAKLKEEKKSTKQRAEFGYHSQIEAKSDHVKWFQVDLEEPTDIQDIVYVGCHDTTNNIGHGFGFPPRYKLEVSNDGEFESGVTIVVDKLQADQPNPGTKPQSVELPAGVKARYVRMTAAKLAPRSNDYIFAMAEISVLTPEGKNVALGKPVTSLDSIEAPARWQRKNLVDGYYYGEGTSPEVLAKIDGFTAQRKELIDSVMTDELRTQLATNELASERNDAAMKTLPPQGMVYAGTIHHGSGSFRGTGPDGGKPRTIHVLHRGNILQPKQLVGPGTIPILRDTDWQFELPKAHQESDRRVALARWLVRRDNPLTWRSIVNRVWQYHFGRGIVDTPNDFGRMGKEPSHPELLDWLAVEFRDSGQSLKKLHKLIVTSHVYRQASTHNADNARIDSENVYLWRMNRRRLTAEEVRDAVLVTSGKLDRSMGGPGFQLFVLERPEHSPHYEYQKHNPDDPESHRRSVYRFIVRSQPDPFMTTLDCADSSQSVAKRDETVTALQALSLLNNKFMLRMAEHFAARLRGETQDIGSQIHRAFQLATGRSPGAEQLQDLRAYTDELGLENTCRLILNLNEFVFVD